VCLCARAHAGVRAHVSSIQWWLVSNQNLQVCSLTWFNLIVVSTERAIKLNKKLSSASVLCILSSQNYHRSVLTQNEFCTENLICFKFSRHYIMFLCYVAKFVLRIKKIWIFNKEFCNIQFFGLIHIQLVWFVNTKLPGIARFFTFPIFFCNVLSFCIFYYNRDFIMKCRCITL